MKTAKSIILICITAAVVISAAAASLYFAFPTKQIQKTYEIDDLEPPSVEAYMRMYADSAYVFYKNPDVGFSSASDSGEYCLITVNVEIKNRSSLSYVFDESYPEDENDLIIFGYNSVATQVVPPGGTGICSTWFVCLKNGLTETDLIERMNETDFRTVGGVHLFEIIKSYFS